MESSASRGSVGISCSIGWGWGCAAAGGGGGGGGGGVSRRRLSFLRFEIFDSTMASCGRLVAVEIIVDLLAASM